MMARVSDNIRRQLLSLSERNRWFMDSLVTLIWCECKEGNPTKSKSWEDWCDTELEWYGSGRGAVVDRELRMCFNTPRRAMTKAQLDAVQEFIDTHTFRDIARAKREIADDLLNDCCVTALNIVYETFYLPAEMKRRKAQRDAIFEARKAGKVFAERHDTEERGLFDG